MNSNESCVVCSTVKLITLKIKGLYCALLKWMDGYDYDLFFFCYLCFGEFVVAVLRYYTFLFTA